MPKARRKRISRRDAMEQEDLLLSEQQVLLSSERTILQFMQVGLVVVGTGIVIATVFNQLLIQILGYILIFAGILEVVEAYRKLRMRMKQMDYYKTRKKKIEKLTGI